ncbi:dynein regulatory complex subunit 2-like [Homarus americanus]|uniref:dynein regulatory complex subunit 2-like n=1 Tax=Homarus americanus TaxID=6706 RepID=UPI001C436B67|nr:dynein regulatory complex subunit 2-like [Homarus americanus]
MAPKKKGKGKGDKLARMTVEQRQQYLDRRAAQEAESNRRKEELLAGFLKLKLADEEKKGQVNEAKLMTKWREILREAKTSTLNAQLQELKTRVTETTTRQDRLIHLLSSQVAQAQHQRTQAAHNHLTATHNLTELHEEHVGMLTRHVRSREAEVTRCQAANSEDLAATHLLDLRRLSLVSQAAERHHQLTEKEELAAFHTTITHVTTQLEEELAAARVEREATLEEAWARLAVAVRDHGSQTATLRATCQQLQHRVSTNHKNLNSINQGIKDMQSEVDELRKRLRQVGTPSAAARELQHLKKGVMVLRSSLAAHRVSARTLIKAINRRGYEAKKQLEETLKEGRHVLELASVCSRLEMPRDRNLPFMPPPPTIASATILDGSLRTCLVAVPPLATEHDRLGHTQPQELETQVGLSTEMDEGLGTSLPSSKATLKRAMSVLETDEGVESSVLGASTTAPAPSTTTTTTSVTLPRLPSTTPHPRG